MCGMSNFVNLEQKIGHTTLTTAWLLQTLDQKCENYRKHSKLSDVLKLSITHIGQNQGNNSTIYCIKLTFQNKQKLHYCMKTARSQEMGEIFKGMRRPFDSSHNVLIHNKECDFYEHFSRLDCIRLPRIISLRRMFHDEDLEGHILMDFLGLHSSIIPLSHSFNQQQIFAVLDQMAQFNAYSIVHREELESKFGEFGVSRRKDPEKLVIMEHNHELMLKRIEQDGDKDSVEFVKLVRQMNKRVNSFHLSSYIGSKFHNEQGLPSMMIHGDLWGNNIMFEQNENGFTASLSAIIDWQFVGYGNSCQDFARLFIMNLTPELRHKIQLPALEYYHKRLHEHKAKLDGTNEVREMFPLQQLKRVYDASLVSQLHFATFVGLKFLQEANQVEEKKVYVQRLLEAAHDASQIMDEQWDLWNL